MKALILENEGLDGIPKNLINYCDRNNIEWEFYDMRERFWPENRQTTVNYFKYLPDGQKLLCHTVFDGYDQLELMIQLLYSIKDRKFEIGIMNNYLTQEISDWFDRNTADSTPGELQKHFNIHGDDESWELIVNYKKDLNEKFKQVLAHHKIMWIHLHEKDIHLKDLETIKTSNRYE